MNFDLSEEHKLIQSAARDFANVELLPGVIDRDENQEFPTKQKKKRYRFRVDLENDVVVGWRDVD